MHAPCLNDSRLLWTVALALIVCVHGCFATPDWTESPCTSDEHCIDGYHCDLVVGLCAEGSRGDDDDSAAAGDDDDSAASGDDDDSAASGDDDDDASTDDDFGFNGLTFSLRLTAVAASGDDDDSAAAGDDDDSAASGDDDDAGTLVSVDYVFSYWADYESQILQCEQTMRVAGTAEFAALGGAVAGCNNCTGYLEFDPTSLTDVSHEQSDPVACDPAVLTAADSDLGQVMLTAAPDGYGDFLTMGLIDVSAMTTLGLDLAVGGGYSAAEMTAAWLEYELEFTHAGYVQNVKGSLSEGSGLDAVAANAGANSDWFGYWQLFKNGADNPHTGGDLDGAYGGSAVWVITFNQQ